ncbi:hypothetical protein [Pseudomonas fulva]|uniref:hypothetical protein n=1 Tax=Pseudomonas fulva TaxID=47880 RepID=UPI002DBDC46A|nr:hypothetical protein [Pseudomonas fulva]MEB8059288.1 type II secretion system F family protein [Pseudomonas fulva]
MISGLSIARWYFNTFSQNRQEFYEDFSSALKDDISPSERLKKLSLNARKRRGLLSALYDHWLKKMKRMSFAHALQNTVPEYEVMVLTAAEEDGRLEVAMDYLNRSLRIAGKVRGVYLMSLLSPAVSILTIFGFLFTNGLIIGPLNLEVLPLEKWPPISYSFYIVSKWFVDGWLVNLCILLTILVVVSWSKKNWKGKVRGFFDKVPMLPWKSYRERESNGFLLSFAILLQSSRQGPKEAIERMRKFASPWLNWHLGQMLRRLKLTPHQPARALDTGLFDRRLMERIQDYSERTDFTQALHSLAFDQGDRKVVDAERKAGIASLVALIIIAVIVSLMAAAGFEFNQALEASLQNMR